MEILLVRAESFRANGRADRQTDMTKLIAASGNFANSPKFQFLRCFPIYQLLILTAVYHSIYIRGLEL